jgi:hypothetical protein
MGRADPPLLFEAVLIPLLIFFYWCTLELLITDVSPAISLSGFELIYGPFVIVGCSMDVIFISLSL